MTDSREQFEEWFWKFVRTEGNDSLSLDDGFSKDALTALLKQYKGLSTVIAKHFHDSTKSLLEK